MPRGVSEVLFRWHMPAMALKCAAVSQCVCKTPTRIGQNACDAAHIKRFCHKMLIDPQPLSSNAKEAFTRHRYDAAEIITIVSKGILTGFGKGVS